MEHETSFVLVDRLRGHMRSAEDRRSAENPPKLQVSENKRFLVDQGGGPFFYLAGTA
jgi:hypothetical protein